LLTKEIKNLRPFALIDDGFNQIGGIYGVVGRYFGRPSVNTCFLYVFHNLFVTKLTQENLHHFFVRFVVTEKIVNDLNVGLTVNVWLIVVNEGGDAKL